MLISKNHVCFFTIYIESSESRRALETTRGRPEAHALLSGLLGLGLHLRRAQRPRHLGRSPAAWAKFMFLSPPKQPKCQMVLQHLESRGPCGRKCIQLMLMMLPSCLVKWAQSLGQMVLQDLESRGAMWPEMYPADAHDAPFLPRPMRAITGADGFATSGV